MKKGNRTPVPDRASFLGHAAMAGVGALAAKHGMDISTTALTEGGIRAGIGMMAAGAGTAGVGLVGAAKTDTGSRLVSKGVNFLGKFLED